MENPGFGMRTAVGFTSHPESTSTTVLLPSGLTSVAAATGRTEEIPVVLGVGTDETFVQGVALPQTK